MATIDWNNPPPDKSLDFLNNPLSPTERAAAAIPRPPSPGDEASNALDTYHAQAMRVMGRTFDQAQSAAAADKMNYNAKIVEGQKGGTLGQGASLVTAASNKYGSGYAVTPLAAPTKEQLAFGPSGKASVALKGVSPDAVSPAAAPKLALDAVSPSKGVQSMSKFLTGTDSGAGRRAAAATREAEQEMQRKARLGSAYRPMPKWNPYTFSSNSLAAPAPSTDAQPTESKNIAAQRWEGDPAKFTSTKATHALLEPDNINARGSLSTQSDSTLDQQVSSALTARYGKDLKPDAPVKLTLGGKTVSIDRRNPVKSLRQFIYEAKQAGDNKAIDDYSKFMGTLNLNS